MARHYLFPGGGSAQRVAASDLVPQTLLARDGVEVHVLEIRAPEGARTIVHFHNNRETVEGCSDLARALHGLGFGVLLLEYRGYGASSALQSSEEGLYLDAEAALDMLQTRGIGADQIILSGASLGTGVAAEMARRGRGSGLVLMAPYTSIPDVIEDRAPGVPAQWLLDDRFDTLSKAGEIHVPTLVIHGDADEIVPFWMGQTLAHAIAGARLVRVSGGHHGDLLCEHREQVLSAIRSLCAPSRIL